MDYISKRKNNIQSISIYCRPHQGLREEKPFCELPPVPLHPCSSQQTWHSSCSRGWELCWGLAAPASPTEAFPHHQALIPAVLEQDTGNPAIQPLLQLHQPHWKASTWSIPKESMTETCYPSAGVSCSCVRGNKGCNSTETAQASHKPENGQLLFACPRKTS